MLRLLLDEDMKAKSLVRLLIAAGHDVATTADLQLDGHSDFEVLAEATDLDRVILTYNCDDFRALHHARGTHAGMILVYREPGKNMSYEEMIRALLNLERAGSSLAGSLQVLNAWRY